MSHTQQIFFIENIAKNLPSYFSRRKVVEFGSLNINGTVRDFFHDCDYLGIDVGLGDDVDMVCRGEDFSAPANSHDVVISSEMFEHNSQWKKCFLNMLRVLKDDGLMVFTCAGPGRRQHGTLQYEPDASPLTAGAGEDYYRNLAPADFESIAHLGEFFEVFAFFEDRGFCDTYFFGLGKRCAPDIVILGNRLIEAFQEHYHKKNILGEY